MADKLIIFDTTLRDGEQSPGASMTRDEKLRIARQLERLRVDVIEAGFPAASPGEAEAVRRIASEVGSAKGSPAIAALARCVPADVTVAAAALEPARKRQLHVFIATSDIHITHKLRSTRAEVLERIRACVGQAREMVGAGHDVEFSAEDASRTELPFLLEAVVTAAIAVALSVGVLAAFMYFGVEGQLTDLVGFIPWIGFPDFLQAAVLVAILGPILTLLPTLVLTRKYLKV